MPTFNMEYKGTNYSFPEGTTQEDAMDFIADKEDSMGETGFTAWNDSQKLKTDIEQNPGKYLSNQSAPQGPAVDDSWTRAALDNSQAFLGEVYSNASRVGRTVVDKFLLGNHPANQPRPVPVYSENAAGNSDDIVGWRTENTDEVAARKKAVNDEWQAQVFGSIPENGTTTKFAGEVVGDLLEPVTGLFLAPAKLATTVTKRLLSLSAGGAASGAAHDVVRQMDDTGQVNDVSSVLYHAAAAGVAVPVIDTALRGAGRLIKKVGASRAQGKIMEIEARAKGYVQNEGLNTVAATQRALQDVGAGVDNKLVKLLETAQPGKNAKLNVSREALKDVDENFRTLGTKIRESRNAILDKVPGGKSVSKTTKLVSDTMDDVVNTLSYRIKKLDMGVYHAAQRIEMNTSITSSKWAGVADEFSVQYKKLGTKDRETMDRYLMEGDMESAAVAAKSLDASGKLSEALQKSRNLLSTVGKELESLGHTTRADYWPRSVKDMKGLRESIGQKYGEGVDRSLAEATGKKGSKLTEEEEAKAMTSYIRGMEAREGGLKSPGITKQRVFDTIPAEAVPHYYDAADSMHVYLHKAARNISTVRALGLQPGANIDDGIVRFINNRRAGGWITNSDRVELTELMKSRYGEKPMTGALQEAKNVMYAGTLANPFSALVQSADIGTAAFAHGLANIISGTKEFRGKVSLTDFGLTRISEEFAPNSKTSAFLNYGLKWSGFRKMDALAKDVNIRGALSNYTGLVKTDKGLQEIKRKYGEAFTIPEYNKLISDLREGKVGEEVKQVLWTELSRSQPISLLEFPKAYLDNPKARIFYMMKSFMIKQLELARTEIWDKAKSGDVAGAAQHAVRWGLFIGGANMGVDATKSYLQGQDFDMSDHAFSALFKNFGYSEWMVDQVSKGKVDEAAWNFITPPTEVITNPIADLMDSGDKFRTLKNVPVVGKLVDLYLLDGYDKNVEKAMQGDEEPF